MSEINNYACSAYCVFAFNWKGMTTNSGCKCLGQDRIDLKKQLSGSLMEYKKEIQKLQSANDVLINSLILQRHYYGSIMEDDDCYSFGKINENCVFGLELIDEVIQKAKEIMG